MRWKSAKETAKPLARMIKKTKPQKVWSDKGTEFKDDFERFCQSKDIATYSTHSETNSVFVENNIQSFKNMTYKHLGNK